MEKGYGVDYISDAFIQKASVENGRLVLPGGTYKSLVVPDCRNMPLETLKKLIALKKQGARIIFEGLPESVPGFYRYKSKNKELSQSIKANLSDTSPVQNLDNALENAMVYPETLVATGLKYIRRDIDGEKIYYLVNHTAKGIDSFIPIRTQAEEVVILDPLTKLYGKAAIKKEDGITLVKVNIPSGGSLFLKTGKVSDIPLWDYYETIGRTIKIEGKWRLQFLKGGPKLPKDTVLTSLESWTQLSQDGQNFSGTAKYEIEFRRPKVKADNWILNLGDVRESAKVWLNGAYLGDAWSAPFTLKTGPLKKKNKLVVQVTNLAANRIRAKEIRGEEWKIFQEINMVNKDYKPFDASVWKPMPSGLLGGISLTPLKKEKEPFR